jgi:NAD(P)-dependent dehydrogenase (short-subunit alcohol dehydrogenase family)
MKNALIVGATGEVGKGITGELLAAGYGVVASSRRQESLESLLTRYPAESSSLQIVQGSVEDEASASALLEAVRTKVDRLDAVIVSVNGAADMRPLVEWSSGELLRVLQQNLISHFVSAKTLIPAVADGGMYLAIGGGMADFVFPGNGHISMGQAAQRMMFRYLSTELSARPLHIRQLTIASMVNGEKKRDVAHPQWVTDADVGQHVRAILESPDMFPDSILTLRSRKQVGKPEQKRSDEITH